LSFIQDPLALLPEWVEYRILKTLNLQGSQFESGLLISAPFMLPIGKIGPYGEKI
jgi:hypothetical protein